MKCEEAHMRAIADRDLTKGILGEKEETKVGTTLVAEKQPGIFTDIDSAVIAARKSQETLASVPVEKRQEIIEAVRNAGRKNADALAKLAVSETGLGRIDDKIKKNLLVSNLTPGTEDLKPIAFSGGYGLTITERVPYGVVGSITPVTNPSETIINGIGNIAAANAVIFCPHPKAKKVSLLAIALINREIVESGGTRKSSLGD